MNFALDLNAISFTARAIVCLLAYIDGIFSGLHNLLSSLARLVWEITWPVTNPLAARIWPNFRGFAVDQEGTPWCEVSHSKHGSNQPNPFEMVRMGVDLYVITWRGWHVSVFTSPRVDALLSRWVAST